MASSLKLADFDFQIPNSLIAQKPLEARDQSKLMILNRRSESIKHEIFTHLPKVIPSQALMVFNDTQVIPSKLNGFLIKNARPVEVLLVRETTDENHWQALIKGLSKLRPGTKMKFELCQTWETKRRLKTWANNQKKWDKPKSNKKTMSKIDVQLNEYLKGKEYL